MQITYSPSDAFNVTGTSIKLKNYPNSVTAYLKGNSTTLKQAIGLATPFISQDVTTTDELSFPYIRVAGKLAYHKNNFRNIVSGCIRFSAKKSDCTNDYGYQVIDGFEGVQAGSYSITLKTTTNGNINVERDVIFTINETTENITALVNIIQNAIEEQYTVPRPFKCVQHGSFGLEFQTVYSSGTQVGTKLEIVDDPITGFFHTYFSDIKFPSYFSAPEHDTMVLGLIPVTGDSNAIKFIHKTNGKLYLVATDSTSTYVITKELCDWEWTNEEFTEFEFNFDSEIANFIVNGSVKKIFEMVGVGSSEIDVDSISRENPQTNLVMVGEYNGVQGDAYDYNQIVVFDKKQHCGPYIVSDLEYYDGSAYVEYNYGQLTAYDDKKLNLAVNGNFTFEMYDGDTLMVSSTSASEFKTLVEEYQVNPHTEEDDKISFETVSDLVFKVIFGNKNCELTTLDFNSGTPVYIENDPYNFNDLFEWVRRQLGYPQIACELTDEQIYDALTRAVDKYNKYRNWHEALQIEEINGDSTSEQDLRSGYSPKEGRYYILPANISEDDIIEIYFKPRFSTCWFGGSTFIDNVVAQTFFGQSQFITQTAADYAIWRGNINDISNLLGTHISYRIYNHHLYITPGNIQYMERFKVGIKYKESLSVEEIRNDFQIKQLCLGYSMITLSFIRGTFTNGISIGDMSIQLNANELREQGNKLIDDTIAEMKAQQKPLMWEFT